MGSSRVLKLLRAYESRNITFIEPDGSWPIVWERAKGVHVWDEDGKKYLDLTAAFGVAAAGHANARVVKSGREQMVKLLHAMGDLHPHARKAELARALSRITFERWAKASPQTSSGKTRLAKGKTIFCNSGFEAVEAALKTSLLATGRPGIIAFTGAYHGLGYGALSATHRNFFRAPFRSQLGKPACFVPFPEQGPLREASPRVWSSPARLDAVESAIRRLFLKQSIGAILVEPVQGRAGIRIPPPRFLPLLRQLCDEQGALLVLDEVFTGFGRTGRWFACEHTRTIPDLICLGKALTGGFPLSACTGKAELMDAAWPESQGEAIHTSTFLGHPVGCAMALAQISEIEAHHLPSRSAELGRFLLAALSSLPTPNSIRLSARGLGLMAGVELRHADGQPATALVMQIVKVMLRRGFILLPEGEHGNVLSFTPPLTITQEQIKAAVMALAELLE